MKTLVVVPTYNEAENIAPLAAQVLRAAPDAHLWLMDDNSPDGTADLAESLFASNPAYANFCVVRRTGERGLGRAYCDGFQRALAQSYERIIQMDADLSHDPAALPALLRASQEADLVIGSRYCPGGGVENWPLYRLALSRFAVGYVRIILRLPIADSTAGYRCWTHRALKAVQLETIHSDGYSFQVEMGYRAHCAGMKIVESPITFTDRAWGHSKMSRKVIFESFFFPLKNRLRPWHPTESALREAAPSE
jgi:dolichol-phosphate mannosyltransferase